MKLLVGDVFEVLAGIEDGTVDLILTSPPFLGLRSYLPADHPDKSKEIGSEATPAAFLDVLLDLTEEWGRVLAPHGSICVELGDSYGGSGGAGGDYNLGGLREGQEKFDGSARWRRRESREHRPERAGTGADGGERVVPLNAGVGWPLDKGLTCIPGLYAASLAYGRNLLNPGHTIEPWRVRNLVAWVRPNPPVGALGDKVRPATSYLTWACRARDRWFDLDSVRTEPSRERPGTVEHKVRDDAGPDVKRGSRLGKYEINNPAGAPPLDWWKISPKGYEGAHYATWPPELCRIPIEASCPRRVCRTCGQPSRRVANATRCADKDDRQRVKKASEARLNRWDYPPELGWEMSHETTGWTSCGCPGTDGLRLDGWHTGEGWRPGVVLDPFAGSGTTLMVAHGLSRDAVGIDIDARNADLARDRLGMFLEVGEQRRVPSQ